MNLIGTNNIYTTRLLLRKFTLDDAQSMFDNYCHDEAVCKFLTWNPHKGINDTKEIDFSQRFKISIEHKKIAKGY